MAASSAVLGSGEESIDVGGHCLLGVSLRGRGASIFTISGDSLVFVGDGNLYEVFSTDFASHYSGLQSVGEDYSEQSVPGEAEYNDMDLCQLRSIHYTGRGTPHTGNNRGHVGVF